MSGLSGRRLDADHEQQVERVESLRGWRREAPSNATTISTNTTTTGGGSPAPPADPTLRACWEAVTGLLPAGARLGPRQQLADLLPTLPALLPRLLQRDGLPQLCPALLKTADCAHLALRDCPPRTQQAMARFFQGTLRGILCDNIPDDGALAQLIWSSQVKDTYFGLKSV